MNNDELAKQLSEMVKKYVDHSMAELEKMLVSRFTEMLKSNNEESSLLMKHMIGGLPKAVDGKDGAPGKDGKDGVDGKDGAAGKDGENGKDGRDGVDGKAGPQGEKGLDGKNGADGRDGENGRHGEDGKDALAISILPTIEETKSYPRGTYATFNGGLWHSFRKTSKICDRDTIQEAGWECIMDGLAEITMDYDGERGFVIEYGKSSGDRIKKDFKLPMVIDRGVYKSETKYKKFDAVTYGGSLWIATQDFPSAAPSTSDEWRLAVKRGRDATTPVKAKG